MVIKRVDGKTRIHLAKDFHRLGFNRGVEIGVCGGHFSEILCQMNYELKLTSIDPYREVYNDHWSRWTEENNKYENLYSLAKKKLAPYKCDIVRKTSLEAAADFAYESIDFVYIDGSHEFDYVMCDIIEWGKRVRKGGIISGHDYKKWHRVDVMRAVNNYAEAHGVDKVFITDERFPSWWFTRTW